MLKIKEIRNAKNMTQDTVVKLSGIKKRSYVDYESGKLDIPFSKLQDIATALDVEVEDFWKNNQVNDNDIEYNIETKKEITGYYYPNVNSSAGFETAFENCEIIKIPVSIPDFGKNIDFINVYGDSMYPKYCSGEIIGIKEVEHQYVNYGYAYVIVFNDGQVFLKYIKKGKDLKHWLLASENPKYEAKEFNLNLIKKIYIIKGVITKTTL